MPISVVGSSLAPCDVAAYVLYVAGTFRRWDGKGQGGQEPVHVWVSEDRD